MKHIVLLAIVFALFSFRASFSAASFIETSDPMASRAKASLYYDKNSLVQRVQCTTDTVDGVVKQYNCQHIWIDVQRKLQTNISNLFACLRFSGFSLQGCVAKEIIGFGLTINGLLTTLGSVSPAGAQQLRERLLKNCRN